MMVKYIKDAAGIAAGTVKNLPASLAAAMIAKGFCVEAEAEDDPRLLEIRDYIKNSLPDYEEAYPEPPTPIEEKENAEAEARETKEDKKATKRQTK